MTLIAVPMFCCIVNRLRWRGNILPNAWIFKTEESKLEYARDKKRSEYINKSYYFKVFNLCAIVIYALLDPAFYRIALFDV